MTFRLSDACAFVGATVMPSIGSTSSAASGDNARAAASASPAAGTVPVTASKNPATSGISCGSTRCSPSRATRGAALTSALSAIDGIEACPLRPCTRSTNGELIFSAVEQRYSRPPADLEPFAGGHAEQGQGGGLHLHQRLLLTATARATANQFDGLATLAGTPVAGYAHVDATHRAFSAGANGAVLDLATMDQLIDLVKPGKPDALFMSKRSRRKLWHRRATRTLGGTQPDHRHRHPRPPG